MVKKFKITKSQDYIEEMYKNDQPASEKDFLEKNPGITPATYYDAWKTIQAKYAGDSKFTTWSVGIRLGRIDQSKQERVWHYLESRLESNLPVQRHEFLQKNPDIPIKSFDSSLHRWLKTKRQQNDHKFFTWNLTVRLHGSQKGRVRDYLERCYAARELIQLQLFVSKNSDIKAERVKAALKEFKKDYQGNAEFSEWWAMHKQNPTTNNDPKSIQEKKIKKSKLIVTTVPIHSEVTTNSQAINTNNATHSLYENLEPFPASKDNFNPHQYNPAKFPSGIRLSKNQRALNYIEQKFLKNEIALFVDFVTKNPDVSSGTYSNALKSVQAKYKNEQNFAGWFERCAHFIKEHNKKNANKPKGNALQNEVVEFIKKQCASGGSIAFEAYLIEYPDARISTFGLGRLKFRRIYANNPRVIEWLDNQMQTKDKILRIKEHLCNKFPNHERLNWDEFLKKNPDISAETIPEARLLWLKDQKNLHSEAQDWLQSNMILDRAFIIGQVFEKAVFITIYPALRGKGIKWYYNTKNFAFSKETKKNVEGRLFAEDLRYGDKIGPNFQKFLEKCRREEIAIDFTISSEVWPKFQKYTDQRTALLVITANGRPQHQPLEKHIRIIPLNEFIGPGWLNLQSEDQIAIQKIVEDQREAIREGLSSSAFLRLKKLLEEKWKRIFGEMISQGSQRQYSARVFEIIQDAVINGNLSPQLQTYIEALHQRGQDNYAEFLTGVALDRALRKKGRSNTKESNENNKSIEKRVTGYQNSTSNSIQDKTRLNQKDLQNGLNSNYEGRIESVQPDPVVPPNTCPSSQEKANVKTTSVGMFSPISQVGNNTTIPIPADGREDPENLEINESRDCEPQEDAPVTDSESPTRNLDEEKGSSDKDHIETIAGADAIARVPFKIDEKRAPRVSDAERSAMLAAADAIARVPFKIDEKRAPRVSDAERAAMLAAADAIAREDFPLEMPEQVNDRREQKKDAPNAQDRGSRGIDRKRAR